MPHAADVWSRDPHFERVKRLKKLTAIELTNSVYSCCMCTKDVHKIVKHFEDQCSDDCHCKQLSRYSHQSNLMVFFKRFLGLRTKIKPRFIVKNICYLKTYSTYFKCASCSEYEYDLLDLVYKNENKKMIEYIKEKVGDTR